MSSGNAPEKLWDFHGGIHPEQNKLQSTMESSAQARLPAKLFLPLHQHIGAAAEPIVAIGDLVLKGQKIANADGYVSAPVHAPTSGKVIDIAEYPIPHPSGLSALSIVIETDGRDEWVEYKPEQDYTETNPSHLRNIIRESGVVGLGGAGFPSYIKLNPGSEKKIKTLILNGVECEPYITCDDMLMREDPQSIIAGIHIMRHALQAEECVIAIEDNKPQAYESICKAAAGIAGLRIALVPTRYPQGGEKQLVQVITGKEVPSNGLAINIGVVCHNVSTAAAIYRAIHLGQPLISRMVTITGEAVKRPRNLEVLFGTPIEELLQQCDVEPDQIERLVMGGPMMGFALHDTSLPVIKTTNCIIAATRKELGLDRPVMPCIRCGACADVCPVKLLPQQLYWHSRAKELDKAQEYDLFDCIECGCCSYVCPSNIPLVQFYRFAKGAIWTQEQEHKKSDQARERHEFRLLRIEREKQEREAKRAKKKVPRAKAAAPKAPPVDGARMGEKMRDEAMSQRDSAVDARKAEIQAAVARVQAKKNSAAPKTTDAPAKTDTPAEATTPKSTSDKKDDSSAASDNNEQVQ